MEKCEKVLIIKTGYSEVLDKESDSRKVSLGDILRTTPILHQYKKDKVVWVTENEAFPLLVDNPYIEKLLPYDLTTVLQLESEQFDILINLEKIPGICALADKIDAWKKYGFRFNKATGKAEAYDKASEVLAVGSNSHAKKGNDRSSQEFLFELIGKKWEGEEYILGYKPQSEEIYDVCLNTEIGQKWPTKAWPKKNWDFLEDLLIKEGLKVSRQDKQDESLLKNLYNYIKWVSSGRMIISNDSLGLHLGLALKKKVIGLFGPTPHKEVYFYNRGKAILPSLDKECIPCFKGYCESEYNCMKDISPETVLIESQRLLSQI